MTNRNRRAPAVLMALLAATAMAQNRPPADRRNFVACPIVRDTKTVPCWLAEYQGELYYLGVQEDIGAKWFPPQLNHEVLVEGTVSSGPRICGGIPLSPLTTSVMPEINRSCNTILPAEESLNAPEDIVRGAGPSTTRPGSAAPRAPAADTPTAPFTVREFAIYFDFDNDQMPARSTRVITRALAYATASRAARIEITAYRGSALLSDGRTLVENELIAQRRANKIAADLKGLGIPASSLTVRVENTPAIPDGLKDPTNRRAIITVRP
jgi:outer membrane protein OmpA-like peptidoglycan-associated protein